ncbi:calcium-binding protein, partial [Pseudooceanicola sp.]|uniref:calcium-binding protein n=1 Tax=Pseudooceanicola sp. TaxID=1914328 RepID=UPI004057FA7E
GTGFEVSDTSSGQRLSAGMINSIGVFDNDTTNSLGDFAATGLDLDVYLVNRAAFLERLGNASAMEALFLGQDWTYLGTSGIDVVAENAQSSDGADLAFDGNDIFRLYGGDDSVFAGGGQDSIDGGAGNDLLNAGDGSDTITGGDGDDTISGGSTSADLRDVVYGGNGNDSIDGGYGNDELRGDAGDDTITGASGVDTIIGGTGNDALTGQTWSDVILGGDGFDFINGGFGHDRVNGGADADQFYHLGVEGHGSDWVQDFSAADGDMLVFGGTGTIGDFQVNFTETANAGAAGVQEAFVIYKPGNQILWALVDGGALEEINIVIGGTEYDLLA